MQKYRITAPHFAAIIATDEQDICVQVTPIISYALGREARWFFDYCKKKSWVVEPLKEQRKTTTFVFRETTYQIAWQGNIPRIMASKDDHQWELPWDRLPEQIRKIILEQYGS